VPEEKVNAKPVVLVVLACGLVAGLSAHDGPHAGRADATFKVGKNGQVKIGEDLKAGAVLVKKGTYLFDHRATEEGHLIILTKVDKVAEQNAFELRMRLLPSKAPMRRTAILAHEPDRGPLHMTTVEVAGELGEHVLDRTGG
jgi:hypothetical protein